MDFSDKNSESAVNFYHKETNIVPTQYEPIEVRNQNTPNCYCLFVCTIRNTSKSKNAMT